MKKHAKKIVTVLLVAALLVPTVAMLISSAAATTTVELAFNNLFVFEKWANNSLSSTPILDGTPLSGDDSTEGGTIETDIANGSFKLTKTDMSAVELYTAFSANSEDAAGNEDYYMMDVEPNTSYTFTYNVSGTIWAFTPYVFMYTDEGLYANNAVPYPTPGYGVNSFSFTTPANVKYIQVRFTIGDNDGTISGTPAGNSSADSVSATVSDIAIYKTELYDTYVASNNLFSFEGWAGNSLSSAPVDSTTGTITTDTNTDTITFTTAAKAGTYLWSGNAVLNGNTTYTDYYSIDVEPSTSYTLTYSITDHNLSGTTYCQPWIAEYDADGKLTALAGYETAMSYLNNEYVFTTAADTDSLQVVFATISGSDEVSRTCKVSDIGVYETSVYTATFETITGHTHRLTYTASTGTYGELPEPTIVPAGMVFAGWYTEPNGSGDRITADTAVSYGSYTVYAKYEPAVDTLSVKTPPAKLTYTVGEKFNPAGLVLTYGINTQEDTDDDGTMETVTKTTDISTGYYCTPEYLNTVGTQEITVSYGGETATFNVTVTDGDDKSIIINGTAETVKVANNLYTLDYTGSAFNRYEITYFSDAYAKGIITFNDDTTEEFFIEPSDNGHFASYIDNFLVNATHTGVKKISFIGLNKDFADIELLSLTTVNAAVPTSSVQYFENEKYKVGIDLAFGGVISYIECLEGATDGNDVVTAATYTDTDGNTYTKVDYADKLPAGAIDTVESVNLINTWDRGRYLQQSYYGTDQPPFIMGDYNGLPWNYNPVQGGNLKSTITGHGGEASKVIDYRITGSQIYVKTRPLDWGKNSTDYADDPAWNTPSYMEAWYTFTTDGKGLIQGSCRFVDYSGYPSNTTTQEFPALYTVEPLNHFVYNNVTEEEAWAATQDDFKNDDYLNNVANTQTLGTGAINIEEPEFWGVLPSYVNYAPNGADIDPDVVANEHWAAFTASEDKDSFGIGIYSPGITDIHYGCFVAKYDENQYKAKGEQGAEADGGYIVAKNAGTEETYEHITQYRHASTLDPATEMNTSYIAPISTLTFESYKPISYTYYVSTGTADEIREDFRLAKETEENAQKEVAKIAVPETVYMTPVADDATYTTIGQNYVNNNLNDLNVIYTVAEPADKMYFGMYALDAKEFTVKVTNATDSTNEIDFYNLSDSTSAEGEILTCTDSRYREGDTYGLRFTGTGLKHGEMATAKWEITVTLEDGSTETYTAYTVLYAPERTVGAVAESRRYEDVNNEVSSWITGATGVDHSQRAPLGSYKGDYRNSGYFRVDPLANPDTLPTGGSSETAYDYILGYGTANGSDDDYQDDCYVMQTATNGEDDSRSHSYLGLLTIDKSRYSNTDQIPNLKIGFDALRVGSTESDSLKDFTTFYTLGTESAFTSQTLNDTPSGWTTHVDTSYDGIIGSGESIPYRTTVIPSYTVSDDLDGKYIHALSWGHCYRNLYNKYATAGTSVLISITDKSELRDVVLDGYSTTDSTPLFDEKLQNAATVLGDPTATQEEIDNAKKELSDASKFALKYDNLFSALEFSQHTDSMKMNVTSNASISYNAGTLTVISDNAEKADIYAKEGKTAGYYNVKAEPSTEYIFEYDVTTLAGSQVLLFFYDENGNQVASSNQTLQVGSGAPSNITSSPHYAAYVKTSGHVVIKFKTNANIDRIGFRFGNTENVNNQSTFSNIRLIDSAHYYENATYSKTEEAYPKQTAYGSLITPERPGYTFVKWVDADGNTVSASDVATNHLSVFSVWTANTYTITYNANGGSVSPTSEQYTPDETVTLATPTRNGYIFAGWKVTATDGNWTADTVYQTADSVTGMYGNVTLTAQWVLGEIDVYFDSILDFDEWKPESASPIDATVSSVTSNGFTLTSNSGAGEGYLSSPYFDVEPGKSYKIDIDITGNSWDVYIFFCDENGTWVDFDDDATDRYSSNGSGADINNPVFPAPNDNSVVKAQIRVDANGASNSVTFSDIRVYEAGTCAPNVDVPYTNKRDLTYGETFGELPVPTREGYEFLGWYDENGIKVTAESTVNYASDVYLKSKWQITNDALVKDKVVIDFSTPIEIKPLANDTAYEKAKAASFLGFSANGTDPGATTINGTYGKFTVSGETVTYTPIKTADGVEKIYYHASITDENGEHIIKNEINVVPASNVLYEDTFFESTDLSSSLAGIAWEPTGTALTASQTSSPIDDEKYGYDSNTAGYNQSVNYSNGTAKTVKVSADTSKMMSKNLTFTFSGTGFDLNSACGANTGVMIVSVKNNNTNAMVKSYVVDTYYGDANYGLTNNTLYQVPIISESELGGYGNYTVQVVASWLPSMSGAVSADKAKEAEEQQKLQQASVNGLEATIASGADNEALRNALAELGLDYIFDAEEVEVVWFDDNSVLNGGMGADTPVASDKLETAALDGLVNVIDSVRVYQPLENGNDYYISTEKNAVYYNVIDNLLDTESGSLGSVTGKFFAYITGNLGTDEEGNNITLTVDNYESVGPKHELYLSESTEAATAAVAFIVNNFENIKDTSGRVMISLRAASGTPTVKINDKDFDVNSNTEMYYDITKYISEDGTVTIQNTSTDKSLLAIGSLKVTDPNTLYAASISSDVDLETVRMMMMAPSVTVEPNTTPTPEEPEVPETPEDPSEPEIPEEPEEPAEESWLIRIFKWIFNTVIKIFSALKGFLAI